MEFLIGIVAGIICIKIFFTLWVLVEKKIYPEKFEEIGNIPESVFRSLKGKSVTIYIKNGEIINNVRYKKTFYFDDGEFGMSNPVYFEFVDAEKKYIYISGADIWKIETA